MERQSSDDWHASYTKMVHYYIDNHKTWADPYGHWLSHTANKLKRFADINTARCIGMTGTDAFMSKVSNSL